MLHNAILKINQKLGLCVPLEYMESRLMVEGLPVVNFAEFLDGEQS